MSQFINNLNGNYYLEVGVISVFKDDLPNSIIYCAADIISSQVGLSNKSFLKGIFKDNILPVPDQRTVVLCDTLETYKSHVDKVLKTAADEFNKKMDKFCSEIIHNAFTNKINNALTEETAEKKKLNIEKNQQEFFEEIFNNLLSNNYYKEKIEDLPKRISLVISNLNDVDLGLMNLNIDMLPANDIIAATSYVRDKISEAFCFETEEIFNIQEIIDHWMSTAATDEQKMLLNYTASETDGKQQIAYYVPEADQKYVPVQLTATDIVKHFIIPIDFIMNDKIEADLFAEKLIKFSAILDKLEQLNNTSIKMTIDNYQDLGNFRLIRIDNTLMPVPVADKHNYVCIESIGTKVTWNYPSTYKVPTKQQAAS